MKIALLTAGWDPPYALGLAPALAAEGVEVEMVGDSEMAEFPGIRHQNIRFFNLRGDQDPSAPLGEKVRRILVYYWRLVAFAWRSDARIFHVLWPNKFVYFDRTILNLYYRALGKKLVFTAHNISTEARDKRDSSLNALSLKTQYRLMHHVFVHTEKMRQELMAGYGVGPERITTLTFPINNVTPRTGITRREARGKLGIPPDEKTILFFGRIAAYKGLDDLVRAVPAIRDRLGPFRVIVAGDVKKNEEAHLREVRRLISASDLSSVVDERIGYIPEEEVELYFKAADVLVLPYRRIYQSGVLFLAYSFGLPVVARAVGSLGEDVVEGKTGFVCTDDDPAHLVEAICRYFASDLFAGLEENRERIIRHAKERHSWDRLALTTRAIYESLSREPEGPVSETVSSRR
jgi:D-inositol-3-phosphate glycosyltransferase